MALARLQPHKPVAAVGKPLEPDGGERVSCHNAAENDSKSDDSLVHVDTPPLSLKPASSNDAGYSSAERIASDAPHTDVEVRIKGFEIGPEI